MRALFHTGANHVGAQSQRKKAQARSIATGKTKTRIGFRHLTPTAKEVRAVKTIVGKPNASAGTTYAASTNGPRSSSAFALGSTW